MKSITTSLLVFLSFFCRAQEPSVEKSVYGIQTGFLGIWMHNESKLSNAFALRTEIGLDAGFWLDFFGEDGFLMLPVLTVEPRYYYNLAKRQSKQKDISKNSANFISLKTSYHPDWFVISSEKDMTISPDLSIVPTWGIRRYSGKHFIFEAGAGLGIRFFFDEESLNDLAANLHLRVGYVF